MEKAENGRFFVGQYRIDAQPRPEGACLRLSFDADILLRLVSDSGRALPRLEVADIADAREATAVLSPRGRRRGLAFTLLGLSLGLAALGWFVLARQTAPDDAAAVPAPLPSLPEPPPRGAAERPPPPPAPAVLRIDPTPLPPAAAEPAPVKPARQEPAVAARRPAIALPLATPPLPSAPHSVTPGPATPLPSERTTRRSVDALDLFDDTK